MPIRKKKEGKIFVASSSSLPVVPSSSSPPPPLRVPDLAGDVVLVDRGLLQKHVQTALVLGQRVAGDFVHKLLQPFPALLDKVLVEEAVVTAERHLALPRLARQRRHHDLKKNNRKNNARESCAYRLRGGWESANQL